MWVLSTPPKPLNPTPTPYTPHPETCCQLHPTPYTPHPTPHDLDVGVVKGDEAAVEEGVGGGGEAGVVRHRHHNRREAPEGSEGGQAAVEPGLDPRGRVGGHVGDLVLAHVLAQQRAWLRPRPRQLARAAAVMSLSLSLSLHKCVYIFVCVFVCVCVCACACACVRVYTYSCINKYTYVYARACQHARGCGEL